MAHAFNDFLHDLRYADLPENVRGFARRWLLDLIGVAAGGGAQPPLLATLGLRDAHGITSDQVERIEITTFHQSLRLATRHPKTTEEAQYSTSFPTAVAMVRGHVGPDDIAAHNLTDPEVQRLSDSMVIVESDEYNAAFPAKRIAHATLILKDGRRLTSPPTEAIGDPENPVSTAQVESKFRAYATPSLGGARVANIETAIADLATSGLDALAKLVTDPVAETARGTLENT